MTLGAYNRKSLSPIKLIFLYIKALQILRVEPKTGVYSSVKNLVVYSFYWQGESCKAKLNTGKTRHCVGQFKIFGNDQ